jgi:glycosyltransferase involved in cell wall biosynthesis
MNRIIGLLIVKNEQEVLQRCIDSFSPLCQEFYILDTGSTEVDYILNLKSEKPIFFIEESYEKFSFGQARNDLVGWAENKCLYGGEPDTYFMMIDADDVLPIGFELPVLSKDVYGIWYRTGPQARHAHYRIWRPCLRLRYKGAVHEILHFPGQSHEMLNQEVIHDPLPSKCKDPQRNLNILLSEKNSLRHTFYLANELMDNGRYAEACIYWSHYIDRCRFESHWWEELMCCCWRLARYTSDKDQCLKVCEAGLAMFPYCAELMAEVAYRNGQSFSPQLLWYTHLFGEPRFYL